MHYTVTSNQTGLISTARDPQLFTPKNVIHFLFMTICSYTFPLLGVVCCVDRYLFVLL
jgi:hypothetical protein